MARGAVQAVQAAKLAQEVFIAGADADAANVNYVCEGKQSVEVLKDDQAARREGRRGRRRSWCAPAWPRPATAARRRSPPSR